MTDLRAKMPANGRGRVYFDGAVHDATWKYLAWMSDYEVLVVLDNGKELLISDEDQRMGFVFRAPDSGMEMTNIMVILEPGEPEPVGIPSQIEITRKAFEAMQPVFESVARQETDPDDLDFCRQIFNSQAAMLRTIQKTGSLEDAHAHILKKVFRL